MLEEDGGKWKKVWGIWNLKWWKCCATYMNGREQKSKWKREKLNGGRSVKMDKEGKGNFEMTCWNLVVTCQNLIEFEG